jgi:hypothetical protein
MHLGFHNNSYNVIAQVKYKLRDNYKAKALRQGRYALGLALLGTGVTLLEAWHLRVCQLLLLRLLVKASNGSYMV